MAKRIRVKGELVRQEREKRAWTQEQLSEKSKLGVRTLRRLEAGEGSLESLRRVAAVLDMEPEEVLAQEETPVNNVAEVLVVDPLTLEFSRDLCREHFIKELLERVGMVRRHIARECGIVMPGVRFRDVAALPPGSYRILVWERECAAGEIELDKLLAVGKAPGALDDLNGERVTDPTYGIPACWIDPEQRARAEETDCYVFRPLDVMATHFTQTVRLQSHQLLGFDEMWFLLEALNQPRLVATVIPDFISTVELRALLRELLRLEVNIRDLRFILETIAEAGPGERTIDEMVKLVIDASAAR